MTIALRTALPGRRAGVSDWREHGTRAALAEALPSGDTVTVSYAELDELVWATAARMTAPRALALVAVDDTVAGVVRYLAAVHAGHAVLLVDADRPYAITGLVECHRPAFVWYADDTVTWCPSPAAVHPGLAVMFPPSGRSAAAQFTVAEVDAASSDGVQPFAPGDGTRLGRPLSSPAGLLELHTRLARGACVLLGEH